ncbi:hypothetical protein BC628DRAFT_1424040 [Trametes gibbosa]|nr:hypothetical protein BC628DRAFT_1424040 [Trametes gibbosa]
MGKLPQLIPDVPPEPAQQVPTSCLISSTWWNTPTPFPYDLHQRTTTAPSIFIHIPPASPLRMQDRIIINTQLFLPESLRLNSYNWEVYKIAIHALCFANDLQEHLSKHSCDGRLCGGAQDEDAHRKWAEDDQFCKVLIVLNIQPEMLSHACEIREAYHSRERGAAYLWDLVIRCEGYYPGCKKRKDIC